MEKNIAIIKILMIFLVGGLGMGALIERLLSWAPALMASVSWNLSRIL